jgi:3-oxoacyl-[acyl-carrier protein] reductase
LTVAVSDSEGEIPARAERTAVVTGGGSGIGLAVVRELAARGYSVVVADLRPPEESVLAELSTRSAVRFEAVDVVARPQVEGLFAAIAAGGRGLNCLVTCAGITAQQPSASASDDAWARVLDTHLDGTFLCCRAAYPLLAATPGAAIVTVSSVAAHLGLPGRLSYAVAKSGIEGLTRTLAVEWVADDIRVNCIAPGWARTPAVVAAFDSGVVDESRLVSRIPMRRLASAEEIAKPIAFLASDDASYISGQVLIVDGCTSIGFDT